ncbi:cytochrome P450 [Crucibulum laeve]|uniref:Cytochrome P450 n=1 Tax=Crucibulum laeve TaxID=68775 RepID=A0A5C3M9A6_9AGAR|nr:cytochrome P450 [Crucibulum laeve]
MSLQASVFYTALLVSLVYWRWRSYKRRRGLPLPPGPKGWPIIGNVYDIPHDHAWLTYAQWGKTFGDIIYMDVFGTETIVLNSLQAAIELLEKRSANYTDRPDMIMANDLMEWGWDFAHMRHSEWWRRHRKTFHQYFQPRAITSFQPVQEAATFTLLNQFLDSPSRFAAHVRQHSGSVVLKLVYGYDVKAEDDYYVALADEAIHGLGQAVHAGSFYVDFLPILRHVPAWVPGAGFQLQAKIWAKSSHALRDTPFNVVKKEISQGIAIPSFVTENLEKMDSSDNVQEGQEEIIKNCAGISYLAGSDTTVSVILTWILAMMHNPAIQAKAYAELESIVGNSRFPCFDDRSKLPYLEAVLSETLRWNPVTPLGSLNFYGVYIPFADQYRTALPHRAIAEDVYEGYYIPAGATVTPNTWAIFHDEALYPEPFKFKPERFLPEDSKHMPPDPAVSGAFGFGRRICPGRHLAVNSAWIAIASILSTFEIRKPVDATGKEVDIPIEYTDGLVSHPVPFHPRLLPRSQAAVNLIRAAKDDSFAA